MAEGQTKEQKLASFWKGQIEQCDRETNKWHKRGEKISRNYRDERDDNTVGVARRLNLFWANTETLKPAIYSKTPVPICERRFLDKDTTGRVASTILERALRYEVSMAGYDGAVRRARNDYLLVGRGQVWIRYYPLFGEPISPAVTANDDIEGGDGKPLPDDTAPDEEAERELLRESLCVDYLHWQDYYTFPAYARTEDEIEGKGRKLYMSRSDLIEHFGEEIGRKIELDHKPGENRDSNRASNTSSSLLTGKDGMQATVYEIWWKPERKVYFFAKSYEGLCKEADDPLKLEGFFPCPKPITATMTNDTTIPVPDYAESQDQYAQINDLTKRIDILTAACKVAGTYDAASPSLKRVFEEAQEPNLVPVDQWAMYADKGGIAGAISMVPIENIAKVLQILLEVRKQIIEDLDRTTGISDIMRGTSDARETMGAQRLKTNNSSTRIQERQDDFARFCRDIIEIMGEIISEQYRPETLIQVSGALHDEGLDPPDLPAPPASPAPAPPQAGLPGGMPPGATPPPAGPIPAPGAPPPGPAMPPQGLPMAPAGPPPETPEQKQERKLLMIMDAIGLLRQDKLRGFRIDIETDSTVQGDQEQEKAQRTEFVGQVTKFIEVAAQVTAQVPSFAPLSAKMLQFAVRGFRVGRDLESAIEDFCEKAEKQAKDNAANPKPDPEMMKAEAEITRQKIENEGEIANGQIDMQIKQMELQMKQMEIDIARINAQADLQRAQVEGQKNDQADRMEALKHQREMERGEAEHKRAMELGEHQHRQKMAAASKPNGASK